MKALILRTLAIGMAMAFSLQGFSQHIEIKPAAAGNTRIKGADDSEAIFISPTGDVGIGTNSPASKLQVGNYQHFFTRTSGPDSYAAFTNNLTYNGSSFVYTENGAGAALILERTSGGPKAEMLLYPSGSAGGTISGLQQKMVLTPAGLGVGLDNPQAGIHVQSPTTNALQLDMADNNDVPTILLEGSPNNFLSLKPSATMSSGFTLTFPAGPGTDGQVLKTDAAGNLSWSTASSSFISDGDAGESRIDFDNSMNPNAIRFYVGDNTGSTSGLKMRLYTNSNNISRLELINPSNNIAIGVNALNLMTTGSQNLAIGDNSQRLNSIASYNTSVGYSALENTISNNNTAFGARALMSNTAGSNNTAVGSEALQANTTSTDNTAIGYLAMYNINGSTGQNVAIGSGAMFGTIGSTAFNSTALGTAALQFVKDGGRNVAIGMNAMQTVTNASDNTALGFNALKSYGFANSGSQFSSYNVALGGNALYSLNPFSLTEGFSNVAVGYSALYSTTAGSNNVAMGTFAGNAPGNQQDNSVFIGNAAGQNRYGTGNVFIGNRAGASGSLTATDNRLMIDNFDTNLPLIDGDFASDVLTINGSLKVTGGTPAAGKVFTSDANGLGSWQTAAGGADNLGNHTAGQNLNLNGYQLVGTGGSGLYVDGIGNVGIGTTSPGEKLVVKMSSNNDGISMVNASNNNSYLRFWENGTTVRGTIMVRNDNLSGMEIESEKIAFNTGNLGNERMVITSGGAVGIGTTSPAVGALLDVNGQVKIGGGSPGVGKVLTSDAAGLAIWATPTSSLAGSTSGVNALFGQGAGTNIATGNSNTFVGQNAGNQNTSGSSNTFLGNTAGYNVIGGTNNTFLGSNAGGNVTSGSGNIAVGAFAGQGAITGNYNIIVGELAGNAVSNGSGNIFVGNSAGTASTTARDQIAIGPYALQSLNFNNAGAAWPAGNLAIGAFSLSALAPTGTTDGISNTAIGNNALNAMTTGAYNAALGSDAGQNISSGNGNVLLGYRAGPATGGAQSNKLYIHNTASDNPLIGGNFTTRSLEINGSLALRPGASVITVASDNFTLNVGSTSYVRVIGDGGGATTRTLTLENGAYIGQLLVIEGTSDSKPVEIDDNSALNHTNTSVAHTLKLDDVITLIWNGTDWLEINFVAN